MAGLSRGSCRICRCAAHDPRTREPLLSGKGASTGLPHRAPHPRRRRRAGKGDKEQQQQRQQTQQPPSVVLIRCDSDEKESPGPLGMTLCKWSPSFPPYVHYRPSSPNLRNSDNGNNDDNDNDNAKAYGRDVLAFDESIRVVLRHDSIGGGDEGTHGERTIEELLRSHRDRARVEPEESPCWDLGEANGNTDGDALSQQCVCVCGIDGGNHGKEAFRSGGNNGERHPPCRRLEIDIEIDTDTCAAEGPSFRRCGVAIPLYPSSVSVRPLQSLVVSIEGGPTPGDANQAPDDGSNDYGNDYGSNDYGSNDGDRMAILLEACWKRQLVGKLLAVDDQWTSRVRLLFGGGDDHDGIRHPSEGPSHHKQAARYARVESCMPLPLPNRRTTPHAQPGTTRKGPLSVPSEFYVVLPSTYVTIRRSPPSTRDPLRKEGLPTATAGKEDPPSPAARLLADTLECVRRGGRGDVPRTFLLSGAPGVGKTFSVSWAAAFHPRTLKCSVRGSELLRGASGREPGSDREKQRLGSPARALEWEFLSMVRSLSEMDRQKTQGESGLATGLVFLDECDALVSVEPVAAMLAHLLDKVSSATTGTTSTNPSHKGGGARAESDERYWGRIVVVGATNRIDSLPSFLRRAGRFDREVPMHPPSAGQRAELLESLLSSTVSGEEPTAGRALIRREDLQKIAELCVGYVAADLSALVRKAWLLSLQTTSGGGQNACLSVSHLEQARGLVGASALRDASLAAPPKITWDDVAGDPGGAKTALRQAIEWPRSRSREFEMLGLQPCRGILLHGPPGCAKTTLARAAAGSSGVAFLSLSPAQVYASSYVGEAERVVRQAFHLARSTAPCILFFDEIDSIFGSNGGNGGDGGNLGGSGRGSSAEARVLSTFLNEMDGVDIAGAGKDGVLVLGATNRPWTMDPALLRPGRLGDKIVYLPPPDREARRSIFEKQFAGVLPAEAGSQESEPGWQLDFDVLVELSEGMTGAEIVGTCQEAKMHWMREKILRVGPDGDSGTSDNTEAGFTQQDCIVNALMSVKPLLSNPEALEEFQVFENRDKKGVF